jgi:5-formyltetrahydrofolate cyclo-ligase
MQQSMSPKTLIRKEIQQTLKMLGPGTIRAKSHLIAARLFQTRWWNEADTVLAFCSMDGEVETSEILKRAFEEVKAVGVPRVEGKEMVFHRLRILEANFCTGAFGIREPASSWPVINCCTMRLGKILIVTPGLAFDQEKHRLGRGGGFYDRFLQHIRDYHGEHVTAVGVCVAEQLLTQVPVSDHDQPVDGIITEQETIY